MGSYKGIVMDTAFQKAQKSGMPQFVARVFLTEYYDSKENQWYSVEDNNWTLNGYFSIYGRKDSQEDGEIIPTLNHQQICKVFGWDGRGFGYLTSTDFNGKVVMVRIEEKTYEGAKSPVTVAWIDTEDADPNPGLSKLDEKSVKELENEFSKMWSGKPAAKVTVAKAPVKTATKAAPKAAPKPPAEEPPAEEPETPPVEDKEAKKKALLEKSKRLREAEKKAAEEAAKKPAASKAPPAKGKKTEPKPPADDNAIPEGYNKKQAWCDIVELKSQDCDDEQLNATWHAAIAEIAPDADEDKLDAAGWWSVKESVLNDIGTL